MKTYKLFIFVVFSVVFLSACQSAPPADPPSSTGPSAPPSIVGPSTPPPLKPAFENDDNDTRPDAIEEEDNDTYTLPQE